MDTVIPEAIAVSIALERRHRAQRNSRYRVRTRDAELPVMELTADGFVIEADGRPPLRGYTDIFRGEERVLRGLVVCTWAKDGMVGYEFKRDTTGKAVPADHVAPDHSGLLEARYLPED